ncbi:MAG: hypothetical protein EPO21_07435 [Chloroflexota bacterium]|nr:MAG: hypothetical protein EPO21_07435 [Chloroflexota bacterium]
MLTERCASVHPGTLARPSDQATCGEQRLQILLTVFFCLLYLLTVNGRLVNRDAESVFQVTRSLVEHRTFTVPEASVFIAAVGPRGTDGDSLSFATETARRGADGRSYSMYGLGQSLVAIPLYAAGKVLQPLVGVESAVFTRLLASLLNAIVTALTVLLLYRCGRLLGYAVRPSLLLAVGYGLASMAWPYAKSFAGEPLTGALLLLGFFALQRSLDAREANRGRWLVLSGAAHGFVLLVRISSGIALPVAVLYLLWRLVALRRRGGVGLSWLLWRLLLWGGPVGVGLALVAAYNLVRFGDPLSTGYQSIAWNVPPQVGLYGLLLSSGKGVFWYNPLLLTSLVGLAFMLARRRRVGLYILALALVWIGFHSPYRFWEGGWSWGPRLLLPIVPFLILPLGELFCTAWRTLDLSNRESGVRGRMPMLLVAAARRTVPLLLAIGLVIQVTAVGADYTRYLWATSQQHPEAAYARLVYEPAGSPLLWQPVAFIEVMANVMRPGGLEQMRLDVAERALKHTQDGLDEDGRGVALLDDTMVVGLNIPDFWFILLPIFGAPMPVAVVGVALLVLLLGMAGVGLRRQLRAMTEPDVKRGRVVT